MKLRFNNWIADEVDYYEPSVQPFDVICEDEIKAERTGLLDQYGRPLYRPIEKIKIGYIK